MSAQPPANPTDTKLTELKDKLAAIQSKLDTGLAEIKQLDMNASAEILNAIKGLNQKLDTVSGLLTELNKKNNEQTMLLHSTRDMMGMRAETKINKILGTI